VIFPGDAQPETRPMRTKCAVCGRELRKDLLVKQSKPALLVRCVSRLGFGFEHIEYTCSKAHNKEVLAMHELAGCKKLETDTSVEYRVVVECFAMNGYCIECGKKLTDKQDLVWPYECIDVYYVGWQQWCCSNCYYFYELAGEKHTISNVYVEVL